MLRAVLRPRKQLVAPGIIVLATVLSLALRAGIPLNPIDIELAALDGGLFERLAISVATHDWLGPFDSATLAKGPSFPIFLAFTRWTNIPVPVAQQALYLAGSLSIAACVWVVTKKPWAAALVYVAMAFEPSNFSALSTQVTRENMYTGVALLFLGGFFLAVYGALHFRLLWWALAAAAAGGLAGATFWMCREEGLWVAASLAFMGVALVALHVLGSRRETGHWLSWRDAVQVTLRLALVGFVLFVTFAAPIKLVHNRNANHYGVGLTTDFADGTFPEAYAAWSRVRGVKLRDFVVVNKAQRLAVYKVSPTARILEPVLENPANGWARWGCPPDAIKAGTGGEILNICDDFPGAAEPWAFRQASAELGLYKDAPTFQAFWGNIRDEIEAACDDGRLPCSRKLPAQLQLGQRANVRDVLASAWKWLRILPDDPGLRQLIDIEYLNPVSTEVRAQLAKGMAGVPKTQAANEAAVRSFERRAWMYHGVNHIYRFVFPAFITASLVGLAIGAVSKRNRPGPLALAVLAVGFAGAIAARLLLFGIIATTQYFDNMRYELVTRSFLMVLISVGTVSALDQPWVRTATTRATESVRSFVRSRRVSAESVPEG